MKVDETAVWEPVQPEVTKGREVEPVGGEELFIGAVILAIAVAFFQGGKLSNFERFFLERVWAIITSFGIQFLISYAEGMGWAGAGGIPFTAAVSLHLFSYLLLFYALWANRSLRGMKPILLGTALNFAVIAANGRMPISEKGLRFIGLEGYVENVLAPDLGLRYVLLSSKTRLAFLGDIFVLPPPYPRPAVFSIGDVLIVLGLFILVQHVMRSGKPA